jgi:glycosyltransferase involved in cell wall biosynthesis
VSYIVPAYNVEKYINETLDSCRAQGHRPLEIVVVNDGSTDSTESIVKRFRDTHNRDGFEVVCVSQSNAGLNAARNVGMRRSRGAVVGFLDADDLLPAQRTSHLYEHLLDLNADVVYGPMVEFTDAQLVRAYLDEDLAANNDVVVSASCVPIGRFVPNIWSFLMRRAFAERVGPVSEHIRLCWPDIDYSVRVRYQQPRMFRTSRVVNLYRRVPGSNADKSRPAAIRDSLQACRTIEQLFRRWEVAETESWHWLGRLYRQVGWWAVRANLRGESIEAWDAAARHSRGATKWFPAGFGQLCRVPFAVSATQKGMQLYGLLRTSAGKAGKTV